jgi:ferredoxin
LHPYALGAQTARIADQTPHWHAVCDESAHHRVAEQSSGASQQKHSRSPAYATIGAMAYVIAEPCVGTKDNSCVEVCPVDCIHPTPDEPDYDKVEQLYIDPDECIDCDACVEACPVDACFAEDQLPDEWSAFAERNAAYFAGK